MDAAIIVRNVNFSYEGFSLRDVSLTLAQGEQKALVGLNGSGKTTLMRLILGLLAPESGEIRVLGLPVTEDNLWRIRQQTGYLFQNPADQLFAPTVWEDVAFGPRNQGLDEDEIQARVKWALDLVGMTEYRSHPVNELSHGQAKRVALAGLIAMRPKILLLDEPFTGLDFPMVKSMVEHARHLMRWRTGGNWLTMECNGLGHVGIMFPEFKEAAKWRETAISTMLQELNHQVYPDGAQFELTMGYHHVSLHNFLGLYEFAVLNDVPMPGDYAKRLRKMFVYDVLLAEPDGATPAFNDSGRGGIGRYIEKAAELFPDDPLFQWAVSKGERGKGPDFTSYLFPYAGF
ncbi:MAG: heparinase II/III family protein, partial [Candidatus Thorarchaeota archaeon]